jgi:hypothetical protein
MGLGVITVLIYKNIKYIYSTVRKIELVYDDGIEHETYGVFVIFFVRYSLIKGGRYSKMFSSENFF